MTPAILRVMIADDEAPALRRLAALVEHMEGLTIAGQARSGSEALAVITRERPDIAVLDIQMPGASGLDVVRHLPPDVLPVVVFATAYDNYAVEAFEASAFDYLLKPYSDERFAEALGRAASIVRGREMLAFEQRLRTLLADWPAQAPAARATNHRIRIKHGTRHRFVELDNVEWIEGDGDHVVIHAGAETLRHRSTLVRVAARFGAAAFVQVHRSALVNLSHIQEARPVTGGGFVVVLQNGKELKVSRGHSAAVRAALGLAADH